MTTFALALLARALVPAGWMPVADAGGVRLGLCDSAVMAMPGMKHGPAPMHHQGAPDHPCAFAGAAAALDSPVLAPPAPFLAAWIAPRSAPAAIAIGRGLAAPPPPPTGPPAFA